MPASKARSRSASTTSERYGPICGRSPCGREWRKWTVRGGRDKLTGLGISTPSSCWDTCFLDIPRILPAPAQPLDGAGNTFLPGGLPLGRKDPFHILLPVGKREGIEESL